MVVRISDKTQNYSKVTKLLVKPKDIQIAHQWFQQEIEVEIRQIPGEKELKLKEVLRNEKDIDCSSHA